MTQLSGKLKYYLLCCLPVFINIGNPRWISVLVILLSLTWILEGGLREKFKKAFNNPLFIGFFLLFVLYPFSLLYTEHIENGLFNVEKHLSFLFIPLIVISSEITKKRALQLLDIFNYSLVFLLLFCFMVALHSYFVTGEAEVMVSEILVNKFQYYGLVRAIPGWHPTYIAMYLIFVIVIHVIRLIEDWKVMSYENRFVKILILSICLIFIALLSSMAGIFTLLVVILFLASYTLLKYKKKRIFIFFILAIAAVFGTALLLNNRFSHSIQSFYTNEIKATDDYEIRNNLTIRMAKWETSLEVISDNYWFGVAPGDSKYELYRKYVENKYDYLASKKYNAHNQYLEILLAFGIVGLSIFLFICGYCLYVGFREKNLLLISIIIVIGLFCLSESILDRQQGIMFFSFFLPFLNTYQKEN